MTFHESAVRARALLIDAGIQPTTATLDADLLARHALGWDLATWLARRGESTTDAFVDGYAGLITRRMAREPVAYIRGVQEFWGREFVVSPAVLIPRPETELLVERAARYLRTHPNAVVADIGTGSGCIAITLALEHPAAVVHAIDVSEAALAVARTNAAKLGAAPRVNFIRSSFLDEAPGPIDVIVTNPPYVAERDKPGLSREVREHEPAVALFGGNDGWGAIRALLAAAPAALTPDGLLLMELGYGQSEELEGVVAESDGLVLETIAPDLQGIPRVASLRRAAPR